MIGMKNESIYSLRFHLFTITAIYSSYLYLFDAINDYNLFFVVFRFLKQLIQSESFCLSVSIWFFFFFS
jgi:hypothetical protein